MESANRKNIKKNYIYNVIYQLFVLITPLVTTPYVSRVLGSAGIGQYSFTNSLIAYFILLGSLGFGYYAQREIAKEQGDRAAQSKTFWEIFIARLGSVGISLLIYILLLVNGAFGDYEQLMWILIINIIASAFDITFLFQGNEQFGIIVLRNILVKIIGIAAIFIFVQDQADVWVYVLCNSLILIGSNLSLWTRLPALLSKVKCSELNVKRHIIPTLKLFIPTVAVSVYTMLDKTLIGVLVPGTVTGVGEDGAEIIIKISDIENGYYEQSDKLVKIVMTVVTSLGTVMIPRNSQEIASGNTDRFKENIYSALQFVFFLGVPMMLGLMAVAQNVTPWFFGEGYEKVPYLVMMLSPLIVIIGLSNVLGLQYLIPLSKDNKFTLAICCGAVINFVLNLFFIQKFYSYGAAVASLIAETAVTVTMFILARKDVSVKKVLKNVWKNILAGVIMFIGVYGTQIYLTPSLLNSVLLICEGILIYFVLLLILKDRFLFGSLQKLKEKFSNKE